MHIRYSWVLSTVAMCCLANGVCPAISATTPLAVATLSLTSSAFAVVAPSPVTLTATVSGASLSGNILFIDGTSTIGSAPIKSSKAVLTTTLGVGIHRLTAVYAGASNEISSPVLNVVVDNSLACN